MFFETQYSIVVFFDSHHLSVGGLV